MMDQFHLAQINIARMMFAPEASEMKGFYGALDKVNALADRADGFVWRLQGDGGDATDFRFDGVGAEDLLINMSVWQSVESLRAYIYQTVHANIMARREKWFAHMDKPNLALWWVKAGHIPTLAEAQNALRLLEINGPTAAAFTFDCIFDDQGQRLTLPPIQKLCA